MNLPGREPMTEPSNAFVYSTGCATHTGKIRRENEDSYLVQPESGVWAVADGMGGHEAGAQASAAVVAELSSIGAAAGGADLLSRLEERVLRANAQMQRLSQARGGGVVGSTLVALLVFEGHYACVWSGDSRLYRVRAGAMEQVSRDHSEAQDLVDRGLLSADEARTWPRRNIITRALGIADVPELDMEHGPIATGDRFVICSDGLTTHVEDPEILAIAATEPPQSACDRLVALALERGGTDNVTVVIVAASDPAEAA
jgi:protein phosphatase